MKGPDHLGLWQISGGFGFFCLIWTLFRFFGRNSYNFFNAFLVNYRDRKFILKLIDLQKFSIDIKNADMYNCLWYQNKTLYSLMNMRQLHILFNWAKTWHVIVCWFLCFPLNLPELNLKLFCSDVQKNFRFSSGKFGGKHSQFTWAEPKIVLFWCSKQY